MGLRLFDSLGKMYKYLMLLRNLKTYLETNQQHVVAVLVIAKDIAETIVGYGGHVI